MKTLVKLLVFATTVSTFYGVAEAARIQATNLEAIRLVTPAGSTGASKEVTFTLDEALDASAGNLPSEITVTLDIPKKTSKLINISPSTFTIPINTETGEAGDSDPVEFSLKDSASYNYKVKPTKALENLGIVTEKGEVILDMTASESSSTTATPPSVTLGVPAGSAAATQSITVSFDDPSSTDLPSSGRVKLELGKNAQELFHVSPAITDISIDSTGKVGTSEEIIFTLRQKINLNFRVLPDSSISGLDVTKSRKLTIVIDADGEST